MTHEFFGVSISQITLSAKRLERHPAVRAANEQLSIFDANPGTSVVSELEVDAYGHAITNYMKWADQARDLSSSTKDIWFQAALVVPPMFQLVEGRQPLYRFDWYVSFALMLNIDRPR